MNNHIEIGDICLVMGHPKEYLNYQEVEVVDIIHEGEHVFTKSGGDYLACPYTVYLIEGPGCPVANGFHEAAKREHLIKKGNPDEEAIRRFDVELVT
jgi:hydrogenase maturation factor